MFKCCRKPDYVDTDIPQDQNRLPESSPDTRIQQKSVLPNAMTTPTINQEDESQDTDVPANDFLSFGQKKFNNLELEIEDTNSQVLVTTQTTDQNTAQDSPHKSDNSPEEQDE